MGLLPGKVDAADAPGLRRALEASMDSRLQAFQDTSTLDDLLPRERVENLFALGQLMVYGAWPRIERAVSEALARSSSARL
jgi:hypothetical protein